MIKKVNAENLASYSGILKHCKGHELEKKISVLADLSEKVSKPEWERRILSLFMSSSYKLVTSSISLSFINHILEDIENCAGLAVDIGGNFARGAGKIAD